MHPRLLGLCSCSWRRRTRWQKRWRPAQKQLPQKADYRLCDYLLIDQNASAELLAAYERTVLENRQGRVSAKVSVLEMDDGFLEELPAEKQEFPNKLLELLKQCTDQMPRLYQYQDGMLLPQLPGRETGSGTCRYKHPLASGKQH